MEKIEIKKSRDLLCKKGCWGDKISVFHRNGDREAEGGRQDKVSVGEGKRERKKEMLRWKVGCRVYVLMQIISMSSICNPKYDFFARRIGDKNYSSFKVRPKMYLRPLDLHLTL